MHVIQKTLKQKLSKNLAIVKFSMQCDLLKLAIQVIENMLSLTLYKIEVMNFMKGRGD